MSDYDTVALLQLKAKECYMVRAQYASTSKRYTFKVSPFHSLEPGDFAVAAGTGSTDYAVLRVVRASEEDLTPQPDVTYRWLVPVSVGELDDLGRRDRKLRATLAMGDAMRQAEALGAAAGIYDGEAKRLSDSGEDAEVVEDSPVVSTKSE